MLLWLAYWSRWVIRRVDRKTSGNPKWAKLNTGLSKFSNRQHAWNNITIWQLPMEIVTEKLFDKWVNAISYIINVQMRKHHMNKFLMVLYPLILCLVLRKVKMILKNYEINYTIGNSFIRDNIIIQIGSSRTHSVFT